MDVSQAVEEYRAIMEAMSKRASAAPAPAKRASDDPDGSDHPSATAENHTRKPVEGERSAENEADVRENIPNTVNEQPTAPLREDASDCVDYHGAPVLENEQGVPPAGTTQDDPGTASRLDVSTEKTAARIERLIKERGRAKAAAQLAQEALADLDAALGSGRPDGAKRAAAEAGARAAASDLDRDRLTLDMVKRAAAEAEEAGRRLGLEYAQFYHLVKASAEGEAMEDELAAALASGQISPEELEAAVSEADAGEGGPPPGAEGEEEAAAAAAAGEGGPPPGAEGGELPPEDIGALMEMANGGGDAPAEGAVALSDALDGLGLTPEQLMELEAAVQQEQGADPEAAEAELGKVAATLNIVNALRGLERLGRLEKRASAARTELTAQIQRDLRAKAAFVTGRIQARKEAAARRSSVAVK
jgi:hypothetical protein